MQALVTNACKRLNQKAKLLETNPIAIETKELIQKKIYVKKHFSCSYKMAF